MTLLEGVKLYPKAIAWAALIAMCCAMEGYDIALIGNFYAFPPFNEKYGNVQPDGSYQVPAKWQAGLANGAQCGQIIGLLCTGLGVERFGFRKFILGVLLYQTCITTIYFTAQSIEVLMVGYVLGGIAFGVFMSGRRTLDGNHEHKLTCFSRHFICSRSLPSRYSRIYHYMG